jgi:hypothetical protein
MKKGLFVGDLDEVDFIQDVERRFGVGFDETDYATWLTLGDVHASLLRRMGGIEQRGGPCATQMAFYRLRRAAGDANRRATPETPLAELGLGKPRATLRTLARCGFDVPTVWGGRLAMIAILVFTIAVLALIVSVIAAEPAVIRWSTFGVVGGAIILALAPKYYPRGIFTLGDLARAAARRNPMILKAHGAGLRPGELWNCLQELAADHSGIPADAITPDCLFLRQKVKRAAA